MESGLLCEDCDYLMELRRMLCSSLAKSLMTAHVRHRRHPEIHNFQPRQKTERLRVHNSLCAAVPTWVFCTLQTPADGSQLIMITPGTELKAANVHVRLRERGREREGTQNTFGNWTRE